MKASDIYSVISIMSLFFLTFLPNKYIQAQDQYDVPTKQHDKGSFNLTQACLSLPQFDKDRPSLITCGKGLKYYEFIYLKNQDKTNSINPPEDENPMLMNSSFSEYELEILKENILFIDKQYKIQIQELIRKEKMDLNLGELIKDFYVYPVF